MDSTDHQPVASATDTVAALRAAAVACGTASPLQATAAAPFWRTLSDESVIWLLAPWTRK